jgi:hypothetical protein
VRSQCVDQNCIVRPSYVKNRVIREYFSTVSQYCDITKSERGAWLGLAWLGWLMLPAAAVLWGTAHIYQCVYKFFRVQQICFPIQVINFNHVYSKRVLDKTMSDKEFLYEHLWLLFRICFVSFLVIIVIPVTVTVIIMK